MQKSSEILLGEIQGSKTVKNEFTDEHLEIVTILSKIYKFIKRNWWEFILFFIAGIYILYRIIFIPISINQNNIEHLTETMNEIKIKINKLEVNSKNIPVNQANITSIEHRIKELKIQNTLSLRIYKLENQ